MTGAQQPPQDVIPPEPLIFAGSGPGGGLLRVFQADGTQVVTASPFGAGFTGGIRAAAGDVNGDGVTDVVVGMASGGGQMHVFSGADAATLLSLEPFGAGFTGGVFVATGDVNADGRADILVGGGTGSGLARLIDGATLSEIAAGFPFSAGYTGGVTVAMGDVNGDGRADAIVGTAVGGFVRVYSGLDISEIVSGFPYGALFTGGVNLAAGDVDADGRADVMTAPRNHGGPVHVYNSQGQLLGSGAPFSGVQGVSLAAADLDRDGRADLVVGAGAGGAPRVRAFSVLDQRELLNLLAFDPAFGGGVIVAASHPVPTQFTNANATTFTVGVAGTFAITTSGGTGTAISVGGTLPSGVTLTDHGNGTATLGGTPGGGTGGTYALNLVATRGANQVASQAFTLTVLQGPGITSANSTTFAIGASNSFAVTTSGHPVPATIALGGTLPAGVTFTNNANGSATLNGTPSPGSEGTYPLTLSASNGGGSPAVQNFTLTVVASGTPIFSSANAATFTVGATGSFTVLTSANPVASILTATGSLPSGVTFVNNGNGTATLAGVPGPGTDGTYPLTFTADNGVATATQNFTLTVNPVSGGTPVFTSGNATSFVIGTAGTFSVTTNASPIAATISSSGALPAGITFTNNGNGTATLAGTASAGTAGSYPLQFTADNGVGTATQLFTLTISSVSSTPVFTSGTTTAFVIGTAGNFAITTAASPSVTTISLTGALPAGVNFADNGNGTASLTGTPLAGTGGPYALTFTATNGVGAPVQQAFTLSVQQQASITSANNKTFTIGILDSFTVTAVGVPIPAISQSGALPSGINYVDNGDESGTLSGTAAPGTSGTYPITFTATNGVGAPAVQSFTLAVTQNTPPTLDVIPNPAPINEDAAQQTVNLTGISAGAGDTQPLQVTATSNNTGLIPNPTVTYTSPNATGSLAYTPVANAFGSAIVTVTVTDGGLDNDLGTAGDNGVFIRTFTVTVNAVNDAPTLDAIANPAAIPEDAPQQIMNLTGISAGPSETQNLQVTATSSNTGLIPHPTVSYTSPAATGSLAYTPVAGQSGSAVVTVTVTDGGLDNDLGTPGDNLTAVRTFTVNVTDVNDQPTLDAIPDPPAINEDAGQQTVNLSGISAGAGETATLTVTAVSGNTALVPNPTVTYTSPNATGSLAYTPVANTSGSAVITVTVSDTVHDTIRTFTVNVNSVNDAPTFTPGVDQIVNEDAGAQTVNSFLGTVAPGANEAGQVVTVTINNVTNSTLFAVQPAISTSGVLTYTPAADQFGVSTVTYTVSDNGGTANGGVDAVGPLTFTITINALNDPPTLDAIPDPAAILEDATQQTINLTGISTGSVAESAQPLQVTATSGNTGLIPNPTVTYTTPNATGSLAYTPVANMFGSALITVTVTDGGLDNSLGTAGDNGTVVRTFTVNVTSVNDAPSFTKGTDQTDIEDDPAQTINPWATAISAGPGEGSQTVTFEITGNTNPGLFSAGPAVSAAGVLTYTPAANQNGSATITLRITDNGGTTNGGIDASATQSFVINVTAVNDAPVAQAKSFGAQANMQISGLSGLLTGVTDADTGVNGCAPTFSVASVSVTSPAGGNITNLNATAGTFDFNPPPGVSGNVTFTYTVSDTGCPGTATSAPATVTVNVLGPVIWFVNPAAAVNGDGRLTTPFQFLAGNAGADADDVDAANHRIFLYTGTSTTGITLNSGEWLIGQGATGTTFDALFGISPPVGTVARPAINGTRPSVGGTVTLATDSTVRGLNIASTTATGLSGGAVTGVSVSEASVTSTTGTAVNLNGTGGTVSLTAVSANGGSNGIVLNGTSGSFTVTGTGTAGSGGTIQNTTGPGILLSNAASISLTRMIIQNGGDDGIRGSSVNGFTLANSTISGNGNAVNESGLDFIGGLTGTASISGSTVSGSPENGLIITNASGSLNLTVTGSTLNSVSTLTTGNDGIHLDANDTASMTVSVTGSTFSDNRGDHFQFSTNATSSGTNSVTFSNNTLIGDRGATHGGTDLGAGITISPDAAADTSYTISNNNIQGAVDDAIAVAPGANSVPGGVTSGTISGNTIGTAGVVDSGSAQAAGIAAYADGDGTHTTRIENNQIRQWSGFAAIDMLIRDGSPTLNVTITGNTIANPGTFGGNGILATAGAITTDAGTMCAAISGNTLAGSGGGGTTDFRLRQRFLTTFRLPGYAGAAGDTAAVVAFVQGNNPGAETGSATANFPAGGGGFVGGAACPTP